MRFPFHSAQMPKRQWLANVVFWAAVLAAKVAFDWFAVIKPLEGPMKGLWQRGWLRSGHTGPSADFILAIARGTPAFLLSLVDTGIFYSVRLSCVRA